MADNSLTEPLANIQYTNLMKPTPICKLSLIAFVASMPLVGYSQTTYTWDGSDSSTWSTGTNWVGDLPPVATGTLEFSGTAANQPTDNDLAAGTSIAGINFTNDGTVATQDTAFTLAGNSITLGGDITTTAATTDTLADIISLDLTLDANRTITTGAAHGLTISGVISDGGGGFALTTTGNDLTLSGANTYSGGTTVSEGSTLAVENNAALGTGIVTLNSSGSTLDLAAGLNVGNALIATNFGAVKTIRVLTGSAEYSGDIENSETAGAFNMNAGAGETLTLSGVLSSASTGGNGRFTVNGANSTVILSGDNTTGRAFSITGVDATLRLEHDNAAGTAVIQMRQRNTLELADGLTITNPIVVTSGGQQKTLVLEDGATSATFAGDINSPEQSGFRFTSNGSSELTISGVLSGTLGGTTLSHGYAKFGSGTVILSGEADNTYLGSTTINNGTLRLGKLEAIPTVSRDFRMLAGDTLTATLDLNGFSHTLAGFSSSGLGSNIIDNTAIDAATLTIGNTDAGGTFEGVIQNTGGDISLTKIGAGSITLSGENTYTGPTSVTAGTLDVTGSLTSDITVDDGATISGNGSTTGLLTLGSGNNVTVGIPDSGITSNGLTTNVAGGTITVNLDLSVSGDVTIVNYGGGTFTGSIADFTIGTGPALGPRAGAGTFSDTGTAITYNTGTGLGGNVWVGGTSGNWQSGSGDFNWDNDTGDGNALDGEPVTFDETGIAQSTVTLTSSVAPSSISIGNTTGTYTISPTTTESISAVDGIVASGAGDAIINAAITAADAITKSGLGELTLAGDDSFTGEITITEGTLTLAGNKTITGGTTLTTGALNINSAGALGDGTGSLFIGISSTIDNTSGAPVTLTNSPSSIILPGDGFTFGGSNDLNLGAGAVQLNLPPNNQTRIITLNGSGSTLTLGNSYSAPRGGNTNIQVDGVGNTLVFNSLGLNDAAANRTNEWSGSANVTVLGGVLDGGDFGQRFTYSGTGTFTIGGASTFTGLTTVTSGTLALDAGGSLSDETNVTISGGGISLAAGVNDTIKSLTIVGENGDAALPEGVYGHTNSGADNGGLGVGVFDAYFAGDGVFTVFNPPYSVWGGNAGFANDANGDGVENGLAWILGAADTAENALSSLPVSNENGGALTMNFSIVDTIAPAQLFVEYTDSLTDPITWTSEEIPVSTGVGNYVSVSGEVLIDIVAGDPGELSVTVSIDPASDGTVFGRLSATQN